MRPPFTSLYGLAALITFAAMPVSAAPLITEFLTNNNTGILDEESTRQDWIEIHNPDASDVDLGGYHLTDNAVNPVRWTFPPGVILPPGGYLVVFASGKDHRVAGQPLHTNFSLATGGEYLGLFAPAGTPPALAEYSPVYPVQSGDISYGLINPVAGSSAGYFTTPTPGNLNQSDPVQFSPASRTFNQGSSLTVTLSTPSPSVIRYTLNRSKPLAVEGIMGTFAANAATDELTLTAHGFSSRDEVQIEGASIAGLGQTLNYYVILLGPNTIKLSEEPGGPAVDITSTTSITLRRDAARFTVSGSVFTTAYHVFYDRDPVKVASTGTLPGGLSAGATYYVIWINRNAYQLSATPGGTAISTTNAGTGTHTVRLQPSAIYTAPLTVNFSQRIRARAFEPGRPDGPIGSESYLALDAAAQSFTSNIPVMILHSWGSGHPNSSAPTGTNPEDTKESVWFTFEPKLEGVNMVARMTNVPDLVTPSYFERRGSSTFGALKYSMTMGALNERNTGRNVSPLGFDSSDDFVLNAPYQYDRSLLHNDLIYRLSDEVGRWAPRTRYVELFTSVNNDIGAGALGTTVQNRALDETAAGQVHIFSGTAVVNAVAQTFQFYDNEAGSRVVTPLIFEKISSTQYVLRGVGTPRTTTGAAATQSYAFGLIAGSDAIKPNYTFGFTDRTLTYPGSGDPLTTTASTAGSVDRDSTAPTQWLFTPAQTFEIALSQEFAVSGTTGGNTVRLDPGTRTCSAQLVTNPPMPAWGYVNGATTGADYYGVYSFQDKIRRGKGRLDIEKLEPTDNTAPNVQGGYVFKIDRRDLGDNGFASTGRTTLGTGSLGFCWVQPKEFTSYPSHLPVVTSQQTTYLQGALNNMYAACTSASFADPNTGYAAHLDVPAAIDHHILSTAPKSADAFRLSGYWHKSRYGKLVMGPIFDFDRAMGSTEPGDPRSLNPVTWRCDTGDFGTDFFHNAGIYQPNYFHYMFLDPNFWQAWIDRLHELRQGVLSTAHIHAVIDEYTELLDPGNAANTPAKRNFQKFTTYLPTGANTASPGTDGTFRGEAQWLKNWWGKTGAVTANGRLDFMDGQFSRPPVASPALPPQPMPNPTTVTLTSPTLATPGAKIYYTTDGTDPRAQQAAATTTILTNFINQTTPVKALIPIAATDITTWRGGNEPFNDTTWLASPASPVPTFTGVGYDPGPGTIDYRPFFNTSIDVTTPMQNVNTSCFVRYAFTVPPGGLNGINLVRLKARYDDGFHAFLNGQSLGGRNTPAAASLAWNSATSPVDATHDDTAATFLENLDVMLNTLPANTLREGVNILAIHALNANLPSSDFLIQAELDGGFRTNPSATEFSPGALEYTSPLTITQPTKIFARTRHPNTPSQPTDPATGGGTGTVPNGSRFSAPLVLYIFPEAVSASQANIQITEVHYHPSPPAPDEVANGWTNSNDFEFIRLTNTGNAPVDITGIYFSNGLDFTAVPAMQNLLPAGASVIVVENTAAFTYRYGATFTILGEFQGELNDGGEHIVLNDRTGAVISDFIYGDNAPWPESADDGYSLVYVSGDQNLPGSWRASLDPGGSSASTYARWLRRYYVNSEHAAQPMSQDDDGDGLNNLGEYGFATDPLSAGTPEQSRGTAVPGVPPRLAVRRRTSTTDLTWTFETTTDLTPGTWTPSGAPPVSIVNNGDGTETVTWQPAAVPGASRLLMRARVTSP